MSVRERLSAVEQYVAYVIGLGIVLAIIAMLLTGFGNVSSTSTTGMLLVGLALVVIGSAAWLYLARPWTKFDDLTTPYYTGHEDHGAHEEASAAPLAVGAPPPPTEPETAVEARLGESIPAAPGDIKEALEEAPVDEIPAPPAEPETAAEAELEEAVPAAPADEAAEAAGPVEEAAPAAHDNLTVIDGIGPKSQQVLYEAGITTYQAIANSTPEALNDILQAAGLRLVRAETWPEQAARLAAGDADRFGAGPGA